MEEGTPELEDQDGTKVLPIEKKDEDRAEEKEEDVAAREKDEGMSRTTKLIISALLGTRTSANKYKAVLIFLTNCVCIMYNVHLHCMLGTGMVDYG